MNIEAKAQLNSLRVGPRKVRLLVDLVRGLKVTEAITQLQFSRQQAAKPLIKLIQSAVANAKHNHNLNVESLVIKIAFVNDGKTLHRWMPRAMGRATPIRKRASDITLVLVGELNEKTTKNAEKTDNVEKEKKVEKKEIKKVEKTKKKESTKKKKE